MKDEMNAMDHLDRVLKSPLEMRLSATFAQDVVKIVLEQRRAEVRRARVIYAVAVVSFLAASAIGLMIFLPVDMKKTIIRILPWGLFIGVMVSIFEWIDQRYIRRKISF